MNSKNRSDNRQTVGQELTARLVRLVDKIEKRQAVTELPKIVTVRRVKLAVSRRRRP